MVFLGCVSKFLEMYFNVLHVTQFQCTRACNLILLLCKRTPIRYGLRITMFLLESDDIIFRSGCSFEQASKKTWNLEHTRSRCIGNLSGYRATTATPCASSSVPRLIDVFHLFRHSAMTLNIWYKFVANNYIIATYSYE